MPEIIAPAPIPQSPYFTETVIFLAGSIEMGAAENWQQRVVDSLAGCERVTVLNPRRKVWDSSWEQSIDNPEFRGQVEWELNGLKNADIVLFYFDPATKSPITLLELGLYVNLEWKRLYIVVPNGYWRKGNIEITAKMYGREVLTDLDDALERIKRNLNSAHSGEYCGRE
jgi:uncharacterized membrane protein